MSEMGRKRACGEKWRVARRERAKDEDGEKEGTVAAAPRGKVKRWKKRRGRMNEGERGRRPATNR
jgi:hypothetical protein